MKILFITPANTIGGAELSLVATIAYLNEQGIKTSVVLPPSTDNLLGNLLEPICNNVWYHRLPGWPKNRHLRWWKFHLKRYFIERMAVRFVSDIIKKNKPDIIHSNTAHTRVGIIASKKSNRAHVLHLREVTGLDKESYLHINGQSDVEKFRSKWGNHQGLIANSQYCMDKNRQWFNGTVEQVFHNPLDVKMLRRSSYKGNIIGMIANVTSRGKRHLEFVRIAQVFFERNPQSDIKFHIYGKLPPISDIYYQNLTEEISRYELSEKIVFKGTVSPSKIYEIIDVLIHPFPYEAFGRIFVEAMGAGVTVLAAKGGGASELISEGHNGMFYEPNNLSEACILLEKMLSSKELRAKLVSNGLVKAREFYPDVVLKELPDFYKKIIDE